MGEDPERHDAVPRASVKKYGGHRNGSFTVRSLPLGSHWPNPHGPVMRPPTQPMRAHTQDADQLEMGHRSPSGREGKKQQQGIWVASSSVNMAQGFTFIPI